MPAPIKPLSDTCPACNRFTGEELECPYCGLDSPHRPRQRMLQLAAVTLSISGLAILLIVGHLSPPPLTPISGIRPVMNHGYVTLVGIVVAAPRIYGAPAAHAVSFDLTDAGKRLTVMATQTAAHNLLFHCNLPAAHQPVQVTGNLYLAAGRDARLYLDPVHSILQNINTAHTRFALHEE